VAGQMQEGRGNIHTVKLSRFPWQEGDSAIIPNPPEAALKLFLSVINIFALYLSVKAKRLLLHEQGNK
jgi:FtsH-binding integral membrane protein